MSFKTDFRHTQARTIRDHDLGFFRMIESPPFFHFSPSYYILHYISYIHFDTAHNLIDTHTHTYASSTSIQDFFLCFTRSFFFLAQTSVLNTLDAVVLFAILSFSNFNANIMIFLTQR